MAGLDHMRLKPASPGAQKGDSIREIRRDRRGAGKFRPGFQRLLGEMARMQGCSGPTHALREKVSSRAGNEVVRVLRPANYKGLLPSAIEMPQAQLIFYAGVPRPAARIGGSRTTGTGPAGGRPILNVAGRGYPRKHEAGASGETQGR